MPIPELKSIVEENAKVITTHSSDGAVVNTQVNSGNEVVTQVGLPAAVNTTHNTVPEVRTIITKDIQDITTVVNGFWDVVWSVNGQTGDVIIDVVIGEFLESTTYEKGAAILHENELYAAKETFTSGTEFDPADWNKIEPNGTVIFKAFEANHTYQQNQAIWQDQSIYVSKETFTSTDTFDEDDWEQVSGGGGVANITSEDETVTVVIGEESVDLSVASILNNYVTKEVGKGLSSNDYTTAEKNKLSGIAEGAEVNVQSNWSQNDTSSDDFIKNKPTKLSQFTNDSNYQTQQQQTDAISAHNTSTTAHQDIRNKVTNIENVIPEQATTSNKLADKAFVNSTVQTSAANFRGNWNTWTAVPTNANDYPADYTGSKTPTVNDYLVVVDASDYPNRTLEGTWRFKYNGVWETNGKNGWQPEYQVNETPMTAAQLAALNSGVTSELVEWLDDGVIAVDEIDTSSVSPVVTTAMIENQAVTADKMAENSVGTSNIINEAVTTNKIDDGAVTTNKINDGAVTTNKISNEAITGGKIAENTIAIEKIIRSSFLDIIYPIGSIYMSATLDTATKVHNALGGTWTAWGAGRVPVGVDASQTEFNTAGKTGGEKTHKLTDAELPKLHGEGQFKPYDGFTTGGIVSGKNWSGQSKSGAANSSNQMPYGFQIDFGNDQAHNNLQPYITCYMYKRTA